MQRLAAPRTRSQLETAAEVTETIGVYNSFMPGAPEDSRQPLIFRDPHLIAVDKPSGLAVHRSDRVRDAIVSMTLARDAIGQKVFPVHRLDRGTSGVLLFALDAETARSLQELLVSGGLSKIYLALVRGVPPASLRIDHPVPRARKSKARIDAVTDIRLIGTWQGRYSLVEARPRTGRFHQIRRHLKHISCPLIGDVHYGKGEHNRYFRDHFGLHRLALHARSLAFDHPVTGHPLLLTAEIPDDLQRVFSALGFTLADNASAPIG